MRAKVPKCYSLGIPALIYRKEGGSRSRDHMLVYYYQAECIVRFDWYNWWSRFRERGSDSR